MRFRPSPWALVVPAGVLLFHADVLTGQRAFFFRDTFMANEPQRRFLADALRDGRLPLWNPLAFAGVPFLGDPSTATLYPLNAPYAVLDFDAYFQVFIVLHFFLAAVGTYRLGRTLGLRAPAAAVASASFAFSTPLIQLSGNIMYLGVAWMPFYLRSLALAAAHPRARVQAAWAAVFLALQVLAGDAQGAHLATLLGLPWATAAAWRRRRVQAALLTWAVSALLAAVLAAGVLLPALEFMALSERRGGLPLEDAQTWALHPLRLIELAWPHLFGGHPDFESTTWWGRWLHNSQDGSPWTTTVSCGVVTLVLAAFGAGGPRPRCRALPAILAVLLLLLGMGARTPVFRLFHDFVPLAGSFRYPEKYAVHALFFLALAAGLGADRARANPRALTGPAVAALVVAALAAAAAVLGFDRATEWFSSLRPEEVAPYFDAESAAAHLVHVAGGTLAACGLLLLWPLASPRVRVGPAVLLIIVCADAAATARAVTYTCDPALYAPLADDNPFLRALRGEPGGAFRLHREPILFREAVADVGKGALSERVRRMERATLLANTGWNQGVSYGVAFGAARPADIAQLGASGLAKLFPRLGVRWLIVDAGDQRFRAPPWEPVVVDDRRTAVLVRDPRALPRARFVPEATEVGTDALREELLASDPTDAARRVLLSSDLPHCAPLPGPPDACPANAPDARIVSDEPERVRVWARSDVAGWLFLADANYPGWEATVDGRPVDILQADLLFRAVALAPGAHDVEFAFRPRPARVGLALSAAAWTAVATALWRHARRRSVR
ncbi:MAG: YfhO family protein [Deltaproteobacteria bacterium]|nr:YfhO family protein [Deltaproteobacteria bacterium]